MSSQRIASAPSQHPLEIFAVMLRHMLNLLVAWQARASQRRRLADLDDRMLRDIGLSRLDIGIECEKPFWRA